MDPLTCEPLTPAGGPSWTSVFGDEIVRIEAFEPPLQPFRITLVGGEVRGLDAVDNADIWRKNME